MGHTLMNIKVYLPPLFFICNFKFSSISIREVISKKEVVHEVSH